MTRKLETVAMTVLLAGLCCTPGLGQVAPVAILAIDVENFVVYHQDISDPTKFAADPNSITPSPTRTFQMATAIADIVSVNGEPARGTLIRRQLRLGLTPTRTPGGAIADITRQALVDQVVEILQAGGTPVGSIMASGLAGGSVPPGAPSALAAANSNFTITGGTGAFLGVRGQIGVTAAMQMTGRDASVTEDPANRRIHGGEPRRLLYYVIPMVRPEIVVAAGGPAVAHSSDFTLVTASKPATPGEILSLFATGLGPARPGVDPGTPFPASPVQVVNSPVGVTVNGQTADVLGAVGFPGAVDGYQVNFRVPPNAARGTATVRVSAAWISGSSVNISIQ